MNKIINRKIGIIPDENLIGIIQPKGGVSFRDERYIKTGSGYGAVLEVYEYPKIKVGWCWLSAITEQPNTLVTIDLGTEDVAIAKQNINKSAREQEARLQEAKDLTDAQDADARLQELQNFYATLDSMGETVKLLRIRLFLAERTEEALDQSVKHVMESLTSRQYRAAIYLNENKQQYQSFTQSYTEQNQDMLCRRYGQPLFGEALAAGYPFHFVNLDDRMGAYLGTALNGQGTIFFDLFEKTAARKSYNALMIGNMGSGKSSLLKKLLLDRAMRGDYIRGFDVTGEFAPLIYALGGKIIALDGSRGMLNPLEIMRADESETISFSLHISKMQTIFHHLSPDADSYDLIVFENLLRDLYAERGIISTNGLDMTGCTGRPPEDYPTFSDLLAFGNRKKEEILTSQNPVKQAEAKQNYPRLEKILLVLTNICNNFGAIFDGHTTIEDFQKEQIVFFDISSLNRMKDSVFDAQIASALNLFWSLGLTNGTTMKNLDEAGQIEEEDIIHTVILIDESHKTFNARKLYAVRNLNPMLREGRKYYVSILLASQRLRDYIPEGTDQEAISELKVMFELAQYKFLMQQDATAVPLLDEVFGGRLTNAELNSIPELAIGQCVLSIQGDRNISFHVDLTEEEVSLFHGGR